MSRECRINEDEKECIEKARRKETTRKTKT
jgi:hypothetical protein